MQFQKLPSYLVTLAGVVILGAVSFSANQPTQAFTAKSTVQLPLKKSLASQDRQLAITPLGNSSILIAQISPVGGIAVILVMCGIVIGVILVPGFVQIEQDEIGIVRKNFGRPTTRLIALKKNEIGWQAKTLDPGLHWYFPWLFDIQKKNATYIAQDKIGIVEAKDGDPVSPGQNFGKVVECNNFQNAQAFFENNGQRGKQRGILNTGIYRINTELFDVEIRDVIRIHADQVGIVEAKDGDPVSPGQNFGKVVECNNFQDAQAFFDNGGQRGEQLAILTTGIYQINTELFKIQRDSLIRIEADQVGIVEAKDGDPVSPGQNFGKVVECNNFQNAQAFFENKGQRGKQRGILNTGIYRINTKLFVVKVENVIRIHADQVGIVEAKDGATPPGQNFGKVVECNDFQDAQAFFDNGGQRGKQLAILTTGTYQINTELFKIQRDSLIRIEAGEIGIIEAKDGALLPPGQNFGKLVDCNDFQNAQAFFDGGGQKGKQLAILTTGTYQINTELFKIQRDSLIRIEAGEIGIVEARDGALLPPGQNFGKVVECNDFQDAQAFFDQGGQKGKQLAILKAGTYQINTALFKVHKAPVVKILPGEIALVVAQGGTPLSAERILGRTVECNNFEDAQAFITNGGQRGKQLAILRAGEYQINTDLFTIVTTVNAIEYGMKPEDLKICTIGADKIGIITTLDGLPTPEGEVAGSFIEGHDKFQNGQKFIDAGGFRGLQEEFLQEGSWSLNPWFVQVEQVPLTEIYSDQVGVIISYIGKNVDSASPKESRLVNEGCKGVQKIPLRPGKYPINTRVKSVEIVPTNEITLNWSDEPKPAENYDANLKTLKLRSEDGFPFEIKVTQVISIDEEDAPKMILRVGSHLAETTKLENNSLFQKRKNTAIKNLVIRVLGSMIDSFFQNAAQGYEALDFLANRSEIQRGAAEHIKAALNEYGVQASGTFINVTDLPDELEELLKRRKVLEEERKTLEEEEETERKRRSLINEQEITKAQAEIVKAQKDLEIAEFNAKAKIKEVEADAEAKRLIDDVDLNTRRQQLDMDANYQERLRNIEINELQQKIIALSPELYTKIESEKAWSHALAQLKIDMPEIFIGGSSGSSPGADALQAGTMQFAWMDMLRDMLKQREPIKQIDMSPKVEVLNPADND